jgi:predicted porin
LNGSAQNSAFEHGGPAFKDTSEQFYEFGANLEYVFNANFSAHVGYDYNRLDSDIPGRSYSRNKVYIGATASY